MEQLNELESINLGPESDVLPTTLLIGDTAGRVWHHLNERGEMSIIQLKSDLQCTATVVHLALGWLLREDKVHLSRDRGNLLVRLK